MLAAVDAVVAQSQKGNEPPDKLVVELVQKIAKSPEFVKGFELDLSRNMEQKRRYYAY